MKDLSAASVERILNLLHLPLEHIKIHGPTRHDCILPLTYFSGVEPMVGEFLETDTDRKFFADVTPRDVDFKWDIATLTTPEPREDEDPEDYEGVQYQLMRIRSLPLS